ncbi:MAG: patatin-like phospholipase family protein [Opitutaceae bacterium]|nr:patatin-like phospholipase family protein [Opitutaceae bacterium]
MTHTPPLPVTRRVLSLDGGGAKGVYSLGFLSRLERDAGRPLAEVFDLVYGTSTGSIIAALLGFGTPVEEIYELYLEHVPTILSPWLKRTRSVRLQSVADRLIRDRTWADLKPLTGIVATNWDNKEPLIFKSREGMAHAGRSAFVAGFGVPLTTAICASCAAVPLFRPVTVTVANRGGERVAAYDGGFCANNPSLFALVDAQGLGFDFTRTALVSVGVGHYPRPAPWTAQRLAMRVAALLTSVRLLDGVLESGSNTANLLRTLLLKGVRTVRADDLFNTPELGTDLLETDREKLRKLYARGTQTYQRLEKEIQCLL